MKILFLCTGNACRSQMAQAWANSINKKIEAYSAGVSPHGLDANAVAVMAEAGIDMSNYHSKNVTELLHIPFDVVITVCDSASQACPLFPGNARMVHRGFDDPPRLAKGKSPEEALHAYRRVRDEIKAFVETLPESLSKENK